MLVSIPESFYTRNLFSMSDSVSAQYWFRGILCENNNGHSLSYFRRSKCKLRYLEIINIKLGELRQKLEGEITNETEWVKLDGNSISFMPDGWTGVISDCLKANFHPRMLFYETSGHGESEIDPTSHFKVKIYDIAGLQ